MKQSKVRIFQELLTTQINFLIFYPFALTIVTMFRNLIPTEKPSFPVWVIGGLIPFCLYFVRQKVHHFLPLVLLHGAGVGVYIVLSQFLSAEGSPINKVFFMLVGIGFVIYSIYLRLMTDDFIDSTVAMPFAVGFVAVAIFAQHYLGNREWDSYYKIPLIIVLAFYFLNYYLREYNNFLVVNASSTGILPEKEIFHTGMRLTILYTLIGTVVLICTAQYSWLQNILTILKDFISTILRFIFSLFPEKEPEEIILTKTESVQGHGMELPEAGEPALFWKIFEVVAVIALLVGLLLIIYFSLRKFAAFVTKMMQKRGIAPKNNAAYEAFDVREKCEIKKKKSHRNSPLEILVFLDAKEKIRRIYKKRASGFKPNPLMEKSQGTKEFSQERLNFYTVREMETLMDSGEFATIYEKARYSDEPCTPKDVKLMKEACR